MSPILPFLPLLFKAVTIDILLVYLLPIAERTAAIRRLDKALSEGALTCPVEMVFALSQTAKAHQMVETGGRVGAILVDCTT